MTFQLQSSKDHFRTELIQKFVWKAAENRGASRGGPSLLWRTEVPAPRVLGSLTRGTRAGPDGRGQSTHQFSSHYLKTNNFTPKPDS